MTQQASQCTDGSRDDVFGRRTLLSSHMGRDGTCATDGKRLLGDVELCIAWLAVRSFLGLAAEPIDGDTVAFDVFDESRSDERDELLGVGSVDSIRCDSSGKRTKTDETSTVALLGVFA